MESLRSIFLKTRQNTFLRYSTLVLSESLFPLDWPTRRPAAGLTPETRNLTPKISQITDLDCI